MVEGHNYYMRLSSGSTVLKDSPEFTITAALPWVYIDSPDWHIMPKDEDFEGAMWVAGREVTIEWSSNLGAGSNIMAVLERDGAQVQRMRRLTASTKELASDLQYRRRALADTSVLTNVLNVTNEDGSTKFLLPSRFRGVGYRLRVYDAQNETGVFHVTNPFTIRPAGVIDRDPTVVSLHPMQRELQRT